MHKSLMILSLAVLPFAVAAGLQAQAAAPLGADDCAAAWKEAGGSDLSPDKAKPFIASFSQVDIDHNGAINWEEFQAGCKEGLVKK